MYVELLEDPQHIVIIENYQCGNMHIDTLVEYCTMILCFINIQDVIMVIYIHVRVSHLRSKEITGIHKPCILYSNDSNEYKPVYGGNQAYTAL